MESSVPGVNDSRDYIKVSWRHLDSKWKDLSDPPPNKICHIFILLFVREGTHESRHMSNRHKKKMLDLLGIPLLKALQAPSDKFSFT